MPTRLTSPGRKPPRSSAPEPVPAPGSELIHQDRPHPWPGTWKRLARHRPGHRTAPPRRFQRAQRRQCGDGGEVLARFRLRFPAAGKLIASGRTPTEIAAHLSLSVKTISTYRTRLLHKMAMRHNAEFTHYAISNRLVF